MGYKYMYTCTVDYTQVLYYFELFLWRRVRVEDKNYLAEGLVFSGTSAKPKSGLFSPEKHSDFCTSLFHYGVSWD